MDTPAEMIAEMRRDIQQIKAQPAGNNATSGVHFHGSAGLSILAVFALIVAVAAVIIVSIQRDADARVFFAEKHLMQAEVAALRIDSKNAADTAALAKAYAEDHETRIGKLERPK
jgi:hypothetical protein